MFGGSGGSTGDWGRENPLYQPGLIRMATDAAYPIQGALTNVQDDGLKKVAVIDQGAITVSTVSSKVSEKAQSIWSWHAAKAAVTALALAGLSTYACVTSKAPLFGPGMSRTGTTAYLGLNVLFAAAAWRALEALSRRSEWDEAVVEKARHARQTYAGKDFNYVMQHRGEGSSPVPNYPLTKGEVEQLWKQELVTQKIQVKARDVRDCDLAFLENEACQFALGAQKAAAIAKDAFSALKFFRIASRPYEAAKRAENLVLASRESELNMLRGQKRQRMADAESHAANDRFIERNLLRYEPRPQHGLFHHTVGRIGNVMREEGIERRRAERMSRIDHEHSHLEQGIYDKYNSELFEAQRKVNQDAVINEEDAATLLGHMDEITATLADQD
jgi:hypothetical protein